jgi:hypothetical protein
MRPTTLPVSLLAISLLAGGCAHSIPQTPSIADSAAAADRMVITTDGTNLIWNGWHVYLNDVPRIAAQHHFRSVVVSGSQGAFVEYNYAVQIRDALIAAGIYDVQIGPGGLHE